MKGHHSLRTPEMSDIVPPLPPLLHPTTSSMRAPLQSLTSKKIAQFEDKVDSLQGEQK